MTHNSKRSWSWTLLFPYHPTPFLICPAISRHVEIKQPDFKISLSNKTGKIVHQLHQSPPHIAHKSSIQVISHISSLIIQSDNPRWLKFHIANKYWFFIKLSKLSGLQTLMKYPYLVSVQESQQRPTKFRLQADCITNLSSWHGLCGQQKAGIGTPHQAGINLFNRHRL